jgi:hypothetical protein
MPKVQLMRNAREHVGCGVQVFLADPELHAVRNDHDLHCLAVNLRTRDAGQFLVKFNRFGVALAYQIGRAHV